MLPAAATAPVTDRKPTVTVPWIVLQNAGMVVAPAVKTAVAAKKIVVGLVAANLAVNLARIVVTAQEIARGVAVVRMDVSHCLEKPVQIADQTVGPVRLAVTRNVTLLKPALTLLGLVVRPTVANVAERMAASLSSLKTVTPVQAIAAAPVLFAIITAIVIQPKEKINSIVLTTVVLLLLFAMMIYVI